MAKSDDILMAKESFIGKLPDGSEFFARGGETRIRANHAAARKWPDAFKPLDLHYDVEAATAEPGEKRGFGQKMIEARKAAADKREAAKAEAEKAPEPPAGKAITSADVT